MKLGIVVVYLFGGDLEALFDLHLRQITMYTQIPYVIYCSVNRLAPKYRRRLTDYPQVRACEFPPTELRGTDEHSYYLDQLIQIAVDDGATHIATLHLDSFPIRKGWIEALAARLTDTCVFATVDRINTACLIFGREFYLRYRPTMLVSESVQATSEFRNYIRMWNHEQHSGIGYGFAAFSNNLSGYYLSLTASYNYYGRIYDDMIFHLRGAIRFSAGSALGAYTTPSVPSRALLCAAVVGRRLMPADLRRRLRVRFARWIDREIDQPMAASERRRYDAVASQLLGAPDAFLARLRRQRWQSVYPPRARHGRGLARASNRGCIGRNAGPEPGG